MPPPRRSIIHDLSFDFLDSSVASSFASIRDAIVGEVLNEWGEEGGGDGDERGVGRCGCVGGGSRVVRERVELLEPESMGW